MLLILTFQLFSVEIDIGHLKCIDAMIQQILIFERVLYYIILRFKKFNEKSIWCGNNTLIVDIAKKKTETVY